MVGGEASDPLLDTLGLGIILHHFTMSRFDDTDFNFSNILEFYFSVSVFLPLESIATCAVAGIRSEDA